MTDNKNLFIAFEGIDGSGKTTQARMLANKLRQDGYRVHETFEPTSGPIGAMIRSILKGETKADERVIAGLFVADRLDHLLNEETGIIRQLKDGYAVVCDRYCFSSYAYQGAHINMDWVIAANALAADILRPHINIFVDVPAAECMRRIQANREKPELYENTEKLNLVRTKFFEAFKKLEVKEQVLIVEGNRPPAEVANEIYSNITRLNQTN